MSALNRLADAYGVFAAPTHLLQDPDYGIAWHTFQWRDQTWTHRFEFRRPRAPVTTEARLERLGFHIMDLVARQGYRQYGLTVRESDRFPSQRYFGTPNVQRAHIDRGTSNVRLLLQLWATLLHSFQDLTLEDIVIDVEPFFITSLHLAGGAGGNKLAALRQLDVPPYLKAFGVENHLGLSHPTRRAVLPRDLCGPLALCLGRYHPTLTTASSFETWIDHARQLADALQLGTPPRWLALEDLYTLVTVPEWHAWRVVVFRRIQQGIHYEICVAGSQWGWTPEQSLTDPDPHTVHLVLTQDAEPHYYYIGRPRTFFEKLKYTRHDVVCYHCYSAHRRDAFDLHQCSGAQTYQCDKCRRCFPDPTAFAAHRAESFHGTCEHCGQSGFHGRLCWDYHQRDTLCIHVRQGQRVARVQCPQCHSSHPVDADHVCRDQGACRICKVSYADDPHHHCPLSRQVTWWEPVTWTPKGQYTWHSHWFYDFETAKGDPLPGYDPPRYAPTVMAWAVRLLVPDAPTAAFLADQEILPLLLRLLDPETPHLYHHELRFRVVPRPEGVPTLMIWGETLLSFIWVCENVLAYHDVLGSARPTLWAHNGSKFDVKFVLDYFVAPPPYGRNLPLSGDTHQQTALTDQRTCQLQQGQETWKHVRKGRRRSKGVCHVNNVGGRILSLRVDQLTFRCTYAHFSTALRNLPAMFGLPTVSKGEFPYTLLDVRHWDLVHMGLPDLVHYEVDQMNPHRRQDVTTWWIEQQRQHGIAWNRVRHQLIAAEINPDEIEQWSQPYQPWPTTPDPQPWSFRDQLWTYLFDDVNVGCLALEKYHQQALAMTETSFRAIQNDPEKRTRIVSPLTSSTAPGWALALYKAWFMPDDTLYALHRDPFQFIRTSLRGGRTDKRVNCLTATDWFQLDYYDFKSLYPSVMDCDVHGTHFPVGTPTWFPHRNWEPPSNQALIEAIGDQTGFLRVDTECLKYVTHPTLHHVGHRPDYQAALDAGEPPDPLEAEKLLFANTHHYAQVYAWPELEEAIRCGEIRVTKVHEGLLFRRGTHLFTGYVHALKALKEHGERTDNPGLRSLGKLLLNSLWGKFGQRSYPIREWITDTARLDWIMHQEKLGLLSFDGYTRRADGKLHIKYTKQDDLSNRASTAPHIAAFVSMWGRVILHRKVLSVHGQRVLYCDTDSAVIARRSGDPMPFVGNDFGDLVNELPKIAKDLGAPKPTWPYVVLHEFCAVAPKTYAMMLRYTARPDLPEFPSATYYKVVHKGFEPSWRTAKKLHYHSLKNLVYGQSKLLPYRRQLYGPDHPDHCDVQPITLIPNATTKMQMRSSLEFGKIAPLQTTLSKSLTGHCNKGRVHPTNPHFFIPFGLPPDPCDTWLDHPQTTPHYA